MHRDTRLRRSTAGLLGAAVLLAAGAAAAYPDRPINMIVPWGAGGGADRVGRIFAGLMAGRLGVSVPVINVIGASSQLGLDRVLGKPAEGYDIVEITSDSYILFAAANAKFKVSDFAALAVVDRQPSGFFVRDDSPFKTWADVVTAAKASTVTVAGSGFGTQSDVTVDYFNKAQDLKLVSVPFNDPGLRWNSLLGGYTELLYAQFGDLEAYLSSKQLRPILAFADARLPEHPDIPAAKEFGYNVDIVHFRAFAVKNGTDAAQYEALVAAMNVAAQSPEYNRMLADEAAVPESYISGAAAQAYVEKWVDALRDLIAKNNANSGDEHGG